MNDPITQIIVQIKADTAQAAAAISQFAQQGQAALTNFQKTINSSPTNFFDSIMWGNQGKGKVVEEAKTEIRGLSYFFRGGIDGIRAAAAGGGDRAIFYAVDESVRGLIASGLGLTTLIPIVGAVAAVVGTGALAWHVYSEATKETAERIDTLQKSFKNVPEIVKLISDLQTTGLLSPQAAEKYQQYLNGTKKLFVDAQGNMTESATSTERKEIFVGTKGAHYTGDVTTPNTPANGEQILKYIQDQITAGGNVTQTQIEALKRLQELERQAHEEKMSGLQQEEAKNSEIAKKKIEEIRQALEIAGAKMPASEKHSFTDWILGLDPTDVGTTKLISPDKLKAAQQAISDVLTAEQMNNEKARAKALEEMRAEGEKNRANGLKLFQQSNQQIETDVTAEAQAQGKQREALYEEEYKKKIAAAETALDIGEITEAQYKAAVVAAAKEREDAEKKVNAEKQRSIQLNLENARSEAEGRLKSVQGNPFLTEQQKAFQSIVPIQDLIKANNADIAEQEQIAQSTNDDAARAQSLEKINQLKLQQIELDRQLQAAQGHNSFIYNLQSQMTSFASTVQNTMSDAAHFVMSPFIGMRDGIANALQTLMEKGMTAKQFFGSIAMSIGQSMIGAFSQMVANWIMSHVIMAGVEFAFYQLCTALGLSHLAAVSAAKLAEVGIHVGAEGAKTAATTTGATVRIGASAAEAGAGAAASQAGIPYIGPILAIAAMGAIMAAVLALAGGFQEGGYTGDGPAGQVAGVVHRGEYVIPAHRVRAYLPLLQAIHSGSLADLAAPAGPVSLPGMNGGGRGQSGGPHVSVKTIMVADMKQAALEAMASPAGEKIHIAHANKNRRQTGVQT